MQTPNQNIPNIQNATGLATQLSVDPARPLVLFPVRLETRFFPQSNGGSELRVRVYPDKVHIDTHEPELTEDELTWGRHFWEQTWRAADNKERAKNAWRQLADRFDPPRAAWIARTLKPLNPDDRPDVPIDGDQPLTDPPIFPSLSPKAEAWTRAPLARALPSFWVALGYKNGQMVVNARGANITDLLHAGPDPNAPETESPADSPAMDEGMKWMVDFDEAESVGMGIRATLAPAHAAAGLDFLLVMGVKDSTDGTDWTLKLAELFNAHHYTDGLSFLPHGAPTNNTPDAPSGFSSTDAGHEASYLAERDTPAFQTGDESNADALTTAFGLANTDKVFANLTNAAAKEQLDARHMNTALWQATWGYFLSQMLDVGGAGENHVNDDDIAWARRHFIDYVRANGPLPAVRIGKQPYGVLPVTSLDAWRLPAGQSNQYSRDDKLRNFLIRMRNIWRGAYPDLPRLGRTEDFDQEKGIDKDLAEVLSMDGLSSNYSMRNFMGRHYLENLWPFLTAGYYSDVLQPPTPPPPAPTHPTPPQLPPNWDQMPSWAQAAFLAPYNQAVAAYNVAYQQWLPLQNAYQQQLAYRSAKQSATPVWWAKQAPLAAALLQTLQVTWNPTRIPRLARGVFAPPVQALKGALAQAGQNSSPSPNYIQTLLAARDLNAIKVGEPPPALIYLLLRHSMLLEYAAAGARLLMNRSALTPAQRREAELVDPPSGPPTETVWRQMSRWISVLIEEGGGSSSFASISSDKAISNDGGDDDGDGGDGDAHDQNGDKYISIQLGKYLLGYLGSGEPDVAREPHLAPLSDFRASLAHLSGLEVSRLEQLMSGTLDLCSHRLDSWITSFATKRLDEMRNASSAGALYGGYGWVMNLKPAAAQTQAPPPPGEQAPIFQSANNPGFTHTPSLTQAATAAVLRSGHLAHTGEQAPNDLLAIDLSSERVRLATWLLDGVRQGQPLGALLGYRFERHLQEAGKARFIKYFRELAPLVARKLEQTDQPVESIAANNVVDGMELRRLWLDALDKLMVTLLPPGNAGALTLLFAPLQNEPALNDLQSARTVLEAELNSLADAVDAVSDALVAESVYQVVRGNPLRAASTVESIAGGSTPPPELEVVRTPRTGIALTHRLVTLFSGTPALPPDWGAPGIRFRADAEPHVNAWVARLLRNPLNVRCLVDRLDPETGSVLETRELRLNQLRLTPLDFIYAVEGGPGGQQSEMEQRILYGIQRKADGFAPGSLLRVNHGRRPEWPASDLGYGEFNELVRAARNLVAGARALDADDLDMPERNSDFSVDVVELENRVAGVEHWLRRTPNDINALLAAPDTVNLDSLRDVMLRSASFGVVGAVPLSAGGNSPADRQILRTQAGSVREELRRRVEQLTALAAGFNASSATPESRRDYALARLRAIFGKSFVVLPRFTVANAEELESALAGGVNAQGGDPSASITWLQRMSRVREGVARLNDSLSYAEAIGGAKPELSVAQLPYADDDRWVGLPLETGQKLPGGKLSIVAHSYTPVDASQPIAGLLIDEWVEVVPNAKETTGIALQYDQPNAVPPQTILIAVPPELGLPWTVQSLQQVLLETLDLARIRAVDPDALGEVGHFLPALYFAHNTAGDTVSTDFAMIR